MYGPMNVSGLPASGVGVMAYAASGPEMALYAFLAMFTLIMAARTVWKLRPEAMTQ